MSDIAQTCGRIEASCACREPNGHDGSHVCPCGGAWHYEDGEFLVDQWPIRVMPDGWLSTGGDA